MAVEEERQETNATGQLTVKIILVCYVQEWSKALEDLQDLHAKSWQWRGAKLIAASLLQGGRYTPWTQSALRPPVISPHNWREGCRHLICIESLAAGKWGGEAQRFDGGFSTVSRHPGCLTSHVALPSAQRCCLCPASPKAWSSGPQ